MVEAMYSHSIQEEEEEEDSTAVNTPCLLS